MASKTRSIFIYAVVSIVFVASLYHHYLRHSFPSFSPADVHLRPIFSVTTTTTTTTAAAATSQNLSNLKPPPTVAPSDTPVVPPDVIHDVSPSSTLSTTAVLLPDWELLVIVSPEDTPSLLASFPDHADEYVCVHYTNEVTHAKPFANLSSPHRATFKCLLPNRAHRKIPFKQPALMRLPVVNPPASLSTAPVLLSWSNLVYDSLTTDDDVVLFVKGLIKKQDIVRDPSEFRCIFGDDVVNGVKTAVKTSTLEVFRCQRPNLSTSDNTFTRVSLEILTENRVVPTVAYYNPTPQQQQQRRLASPNGKSLLCACTMIYNVAKFLREWVYYHSKIGVEKFLLYDNGSDDDVIKIVDELNREGYDVSTYFWLWPKTQEAGFSHGVLYAKQSCTWMIYIDVDEFVYSPKWLSNSSNTSHPSKSMLQSLLLHDQQTGHGDSRELEMASLKLSNPPPLTSPLGQLSFWCNEFGPSNQTTHPITGVTQGYNCRTKSKNRHKSMVLLEAVDDSLYNVIHHFKLKSGYRSIILNTRSMIVNHYKYQAWPEFRTKFKRRVSAYVIDWTQPFNLNSQDRPRGLGPRPIEPENWLTRYCQVTDNKLRDLTRRWFAIESPEGYRMPWQR